MKKDEMLARIEEMINDPETNLFIKKIRDSYFVTLTHQTKTVNIRGEERKKKVEIAFKIIDSGEYVLRVGYDTWSTYTKEELSYFFNMLDEKYIELIETSKDKKINRVEGKILGW